jgi:preprotein translocase subunit YajC
VGETLSRLAGAASLFAQDGGGAAAPDAFEMLRPVIFVFLPIAVLFYFMMLRPQRREQTRRQDMLAAVKKNDRVLTIGGVYGVVTNVQRETDEVTIKVDESNNTKLRMTLSSISQVLGNEPSSE